MNYFYTTSFNNDAWFNGGTSGGTDGAREGACTMIGGDPEKFAEIEQIFEDVSIQNGYLYTTVKEINSFFL
ncbi:NAD(P)-binding domain-containing protein [Virgibacillus necropolis]|uniref:6-phosphogluconate dehydrogenase NADP-binding domain-containing protein n=1 Tax=Virgibacillus necropolis TaxID=163877 RepID=A0A221MI36_9BACI|nr:hypothetical protein CFK40_02550 [Virgibacillus necropolis]